MDQELESSPAVSSEADAAAAFEHLAARLALLEAAITGLAAQRNAIDIPDYSETLGTLAHNLGVYGDIVKAMRESPAFALSPDRIAQQLVMAGKEAREADHGAITRAQVAMDRSVRSIGAALTSARTAQAQRRQLIRAGAAGILLGVLLWAVVPGPVARALPDRWHLPERMAARMLGSDMWHGGEQLLNAANPAQWQDVVTGSRIVHDNRTTIDACLKSASKARKEARCTVTFRPAVLSQRQHPIR